MLRRISVAALSVLVLVAAGAASAQTLDEIVAKHIGALGGKEKLKAVQSIRMTGKMVMGQGMEAPLTIEVMRPDKMRSEFVFQGMTGIQAFDGKVGWQIMPFMGKTDPEVLPEEAVKRFREQADWEGPLVDWQQKGHKVELVGKEAVEGTDTWALKITLKDGETRTVYLDAEQYLPIKMTAKISMQGQEIDVESSIGDYREISGLMFPFVMESRPKGAPVGQQMVFEKIEVNPAIDDSRFKMPEVKKPEPPKAEEKPPTEEKKK